MEELQEFDERITSFQSDSVPDEPVFGLPASLKEKIAPGCGALQPFHGDTIAYFLDARVMGLAGAIADELHLRFGESLSQPHEHERRHRPQGGERGGASQVGEGPEPLR
ncbi:hypothetical protein [Actinomyces bowdenii]|uniref:hypothetical protein n=1 Tax=Actinomyces bowdenii TaxID=131109 RepID=UPI001FD0C2FE|nr:hypothetical protein [Actinomyces bowdenii]